MTIWKENIFASFCDEPCELLQFGSWFNSCFPRREALGDRTASTSTVAELWQMMAQSIAFLVMRFISSSSLDLKQPLRQFAFHHFLLKPCGPRVQVVTVQVFSRRGCRKLHLAKADYVLKIRPETEETHFGIIMSQMKTTELDLSVILGRCSRNAHRLWARSHLEKYGTQGPWLMTR